MPILFTDVCKMMISEGERAKGSFEITEQNEE